MVKVVTRRAAAIVAFTLASAASGLFVAEAPAMASGTTRYVATTGSNTDNDCTDHAHPCQTIQYAVDQADSGDTISIAAGTYDESVEIHESLTVIGAGATGSGRTTIDGDSDNDASIEIDDFDTDGAFQVTLENLDISGNSGGDGVLVGGSPEVEDPVGITILDCVIDNNDLGSGDEEESNTGNGVELVGSVTATVNGTTINGNEEEGLITDEIEDDPPVVTMSDDVASNNGSGGVVSESGSISVSSTTLDHNTGAGVVASQAGSTVTVDTSTVSGTVPFTQTPDGGPEFGAGVIGLFGGVASVQSSTIVGNTGQGVLSYDGAVSIANSTISGTVTPTHPDEGIPDAGVAIAEELPGIAKKGTARFAHARPATKHAKSGASTSAAIEAPTATLSATITADNSTLPDCSGSVGDSGYNLESDDSCGFTAKGSINNGTAKLGPLANNGGPTKTLLPAKGSDAIDAIPVTAASCTSPASDQRGVSRPQGPACDIGAVEAAQPPIVITPKSLPNGKVGKHYSVTLKATGGLGAPYEFSLAPSSDPLPPGLSISTGGVISGTPTKAGTYPIIVSVDDPKLKHYTIVITAPTPSPSKSSSPQGATLPNTGLNVDRLLTLAALVLGLGVMLLGAPGLLGRRRRYRRSH